MEIIPVRTMEEVLDIVLAPREEEKNGAVAPAPIEVEDAPRPPLRETGRVIDAPAVAGI
jgi:hypothetical protein